MCIGRLDDQQGSSGGRALTLTISCFVFELRSQLPLKCNYEVANAFWVPLSYLQHSANRMEFETSYRDRPYPAVRLPRNRVLWGLTFRFVQNLLDIIPSA